MDRGQTPTKRSLGFKKRSLGFIHGLFSLFLIPKILFRSDLKWIRIQKSDLVCLYLNMCIYLNILCIYNVSFSPSLKEWHKGVRFDLFLYLPMNRMFVTIGAEFSQFQSIRRIVSILLSNISGNARWCLINTVSDTTGTLQNNRYSNIFTLGHEPPLDFLFTQLFHFRSETKKKNERKKIEVTNSKFNYERFRCNQ